MVGEAGHVVGEGAHNAGCLIVVQGTGELQVLNVP